MNDAAFAAARQIQPLLNGKDCRIGLILGSGLGGYAETLEDPRYLSYSDIPGFPVSKVEGHAGRFVVGERYGKTAVVMQGRFHYYEGWSPNELVCGVRAMKLLGVEKLLLTNAAGGVDTSFRPGTLMLIRDHINYSGCNPLIGENDPRFGPRFPDMSQVYDPAFRQAVRALSIKKGYGLEEGVYMMFSGPSFETPAEIVMARALGASAVGMSTVPEAIGAAHCGIRVLGVSLITNLAAGILEQKLTHDEVQKAASEASERFTLLVDDILREVF